MINFMPVPIKSLKSLPLAALCVFGDLKVSKSGSKIGQKKRDKKQKKKDDAYIVRR